MNLSTRSALIAVFRIICRDKSKKATFSGGPVT
ncbi:hypothetical protein KP1_1601 [Klebsiella pneumoniae subsp. pneumoniae NTUH-K2044]|nr:hypothetical protein KP1_1601 [Klebsiella pneumoniae subsp. pneumoniae NTUH-K2044]